MIEDEFKPDILDDEALKIFSEPGIVTIETPTGSLKMPGIDWKRILKKLKKL